MPFIENEDEFVERQGCERVRTTQGWVFLNGAYMIDGQGMFNPSGDPIEHLKKRILFFETKTAALIRVYRHDYKAINEQADFHKRGAGPAPLPGAIGHLKILSMRIEKCKSKLEKLQAQLPTHIDSKEIDTERANRVATGRKIEAELMQLPSY